jgi:hypothetical protein
VVTLVGTSTTHALLTSGTTYSIPAGTTSMKVWIGGGGGGGGGHGGAGSCSGGGAGGIAYAEITL